MADAIQINREKHPGAFVIAEKLAEQENRTLTNAVETLLLEDGNARIAKNEGASQEQNKEVA